MEEFEKFIIEKANKLKIPISVNLELTPLCNMNCDMCYIRLNPNEVSQYGKIHSGEEWIDVIKQLKEHGALYILLTGGEPLLHPDFKLIYRTLIELGFIVTINTNGTLITEDIATFLAASKPRRVNITLYGTSNETYAKLCHNPQGYDQTVQGIKLLQKEGINIKINGTIVPENKDEIPILLEHAKEWDVPIKLDTYMFPFYRNKTKSYNLEQRLAVTEAAKADYDIKRLSLGEETYNKYRENFITTLQETESNTFEEHFFDCRAGFSSCWIAWTGNMSPCVFMNSPAKNVFDTAFSDIWDYITDRMPGLPDCNACKSCENRNVCSICRACILAEKLDKNNRPSYICQWMEEYKKLVLSE